MDEELLAAVRNYLDITWEDEASDVKLRGIIRRGITYLNRRYGGEPDYGEGSRGRELLFEYARYARANALADFGEDFLTELNDFHGDGEVSRFESEYPELC